MQTLKQDLIKLKCFKMTIILTFKALKGSKSKLYALI
jgi:hypothetical protein